MIMKTVDIDYIVPMVFPSDPEWRKVLKKAIGYDDSGDARYRSWGTEELLVRCIRKYMPWVRRIVILLAQQSQVQPWMTGEDIRVVFHREFIPEAYLPTFNSRCIEMFLHRIPDISERFLYANDDMFPLSPMQPAEFFLGDRPIQHMILKDYPDVPNNFQRACMRGLNFVAAEFNIRFTNTWIKNGHSIAPILLSSCLHLWQRGQQQILKSITPFREDCNFNQYIYAWYQYFANVAVDRGEPRRQLLTVHNHTIDDIIAQVRRPDCGVLCINDNERLFDYESYARPLREAIEAKLME